MKPSLKGMYIASITLVLWAIVIQATEPDRSIQTQRVAEKIRNHIVTSSSMWPQAWCDEYVDTIVHTLERSEQLPDYVLRFDILERGFESYWEDVKTDLRRPTFEVQCAEIRWYVEHLMSMPLPSEQDKTILRRQWERLCQDATRSLLIQFPFLDPNIVDTARADLISRCMCDIEAPLKPVFAQPMTDEQMNQINRGWHDMRYARVSIMSQLGGEEVFLVERPWEQDLSKHPDYLLTERSLDQLLRYIWVVAIDPPDDYQKALQNRNEAQRHRLQETSMDRTLETRIRRERCRQIEQIEYLSFLLAVLLESPSCLELSTVGDTRKNHIHWLVQDRQRRWCLCDR